MAGTPSASGAGRQQQWWVVPKQMATGRGNVQQFVAVQSSAKPSNSIAGPFPSAAAAQKWITSHNAQVPNPVNAIQKGVTGWLSGLGGQLASGLEAGLMQSLNDLWNVIVGPVEIIIGVVIAIITIGWFLKDDILAVIRAVGGIAVAGAATA